MIISPQRFEIYDEVNGCYTFSSVWLQTRLQAQAAGVPYQGLCRTASVDSNTVC